MELVQLPAFHVVGILVTADWQGLWQEMPAAWSRFLARSGEIQDRVGDTFFDISLRQEGERYTQLICAEVSHAEQAPQEMTTLLIPAHAYVKHRHEGELAGIADSFGKMYAWGKSRGHDLGSFKLDSGYTLAGRETYHDLYIRAGR